MTNPADRFDTTKADAGTILADIKGAFGDLAQTIHDAVDAAKPEIVSALQHLELALHLISGVPETREPSTPPPEPVSNNEGEPQGKDASEFAPKG
jgi:hypothetical protein